MIIQTDAFLTGWGAVCNGAQTSGQWSEEERTLYINVLELPAIKLALFSFIKGKKRKNSESHKLSDRKQGNLILVFENGGGGADKERI